MTLKEKIEKQAPDPSMNYSKLVFTAGAAAALKAVIEMIEKRKEEMEAIHEWEASYEDEYIIDLLKSEA